MCLSVLWGGVLSPGGGGGGGGGRYLEVKEELEGSVVTEGVVGDGQVHSDHHQHEEKG